MHDSLSFETWDKYLQNNQALKELWIKLIQKEKNEHAIFEILTKHEYNNFKRKEIYNPDTMQQEHTNYFEDRKLRRALVKIREIRGAFLRADTINHLLILIKNIQACQLAIRTKYPQTTIKDQNSTLDPQYLHKLSEKLNSLDLNELYAHDPDEPRRNR